MDVNCLLESALSELQYLLPGEVFSLKDLFKGYEWKRIPQGDKSTLGTLFLNHIASIPNIEVVKKNGGLKEYIVKN